MNYGGTKYAQNSSEIGVCQNVTYTNDSKNCTTVSINEFENFGTTAYYLYRTTFGYELNETAMNSIDESLTFAFVGSYIGLTTLVLVNIFIAQLTTTFARLYKNAESYHYFKKAIEILESEKWVILLETLPFCCSKRKKNIENFRDKNNPKLREKELKFSMIEKFFGTDYKNTSTKEKISNLEAEMREQQKLIMEQLKSLDKSVI